MLDSEKNEPVAEPTKDTTTVPVAEPTKDAVTEPVAEPTKDTATEQPTTDYAPGTTGVAGAGAQKMVEDGGFIQELKALIAKYEGTSDAAPEKKDESEKKDAPEPTKGEEKEEKKDAEPTKDSRPVEPVTATIDSAGSSAKGIDSFMNDFLGKE